MKAAIENTIEQLHHEIQALNEEDNRDNKDRLEALISQLEKLLDEREQVKSEDIGQTLKAVVAEFELSHPRIAGIINQLMVTLGNMGI